MSSGATFCLVSSSIWSLTIGQTLFCKLSRFSLGARLVGVSTCNAFISIGCTDLVGRMLLSRNPAFKHLNALLAVSTRGSTGKRSVQELHSGPAPDLSQAGQKRRKGASTPATGANTSPLSGTQPSTDAADPTQLPVNPNAQPADQHMPTAADELTDHSLVDDIAEAYAADPFFADDAKTADLTFAQGLWWKGGLIVVPDSKDTKRLIFEAFHDHPMAGHFGCANTLKAIKSRFYWRYADKKVGDYVCNCPSCQLQTTQPSRPAGLLQPLDVPPHAWHTVTTDYITGLPRTPKGNNAIAVFVDKLTKYVYAVPCSDTSDAVDWANIMLNMLCSMRDCLLSSSLTEALSSKVHSTGL